jgi:hypothetical protein
LGAVGATSAAVALYVLHNIFYASFSYVSGLLADRFPKKRLLAVLFLTGAMLVIRRCRDVVAVKADFECR